MDTEKFTINAIICDILDNFTTNCISGLKNEVGSSQFYQNDSNVFEIENLTMDTKYYASLSGIMILIIIFFSVTFFVYPNEIYQQSDLIPVPKLDVKLSSNEIEHGESFVLDVVSTNTGDIADIQIVSIAFPELDDVSDIVKIKNYDFTQSPHYVKIGDEIGANYSGGKETILARYPSIEAYSRPVPSGTMNIISVQVYPPEPGVFDVYVKSIGIPHFADESHYPRNGIFDHQSELVEVYSVTVKP